VLPILSESVENSINSIAITPIFDGLDCPQNEHYSTTAHERGSEKLFDGRSLNRFDLLACNQPANIDLGMVRVPADSRDGLWCFAPLTTWKTDHQRTNQQDQNIPAHQ
jgi:hypothetical protein